LGQAAIELPGSTNHSGSRVEHPLKPVRDGPWRPSQHYFTRRNENL